MLPHDLKKALAEWRGEAEGDDKTLLRHALNYISDLEDKIVEVNVLTNSIKRVIK